MLIYKCFGFAIPTAILWGISRAGFIIDSLFDLREDMALGYINIPAEDIENYGVDMHALESYEMQTWMRDKMETLRGFFLLLSILEISPH